MLDPALQELKDIVDATPELMECEGGEPWWPNGWACLKIDLRLMTEEQKGKLWQAQSLLREAGIYFDSGAGSGVMDWELDWSLSGARIEVRPLHCMCREGHDGIYNLPPAATVYWTSFKSPRGNVLAFPYCSEQCRASDQHGEGWEVIVQDAQSEQEPA